MYASSIPLGVATEINRSAVEDASWMRREESNHVNIAELDAVIKVLNLACQGSESAHRLFYSAALDI